MTYHHAGDQPVYAPNSYGGPQADPELGREVTWEVPGAELGRYAYEKHSGDDDFVQPRTLVNQVMSQTDRDHLVANIVGHASNEVTDEIQWRVIAYWTNVDAQLGASVAAGLGKSDGASANGAQAASQQLVASRANRA
jgi:catalase